jgi:hypothetical protein
MLRSTALAMLACFGLAGSAQATNFALSGVFADGGTATGSFSLNIYGQFATIDLVTAGSTNGGSFPGYAYSYQGVPGGTAAGEHAPGSLVFDIHRLNPLGSQYQTLSHIVLAASPTSGIIPLDLTASYECVGSYSCGNPAAANLTIRYFESGSVAVPVGALPVPLAAVLF